MGGIDLLKRAADAGLTVTRNGDRLVIQGPKSASAIVKELIAHKPEVLDALETPEVAALVVKRPARQITQRPAPFVDSDLLDSIMSYLFRHPNGATAGQIQSALASRQVCSTTMDRAIDTLNKQGKIDIDNSPVPLIKAKNQN